MYIRAARVVRGRSEMRARHSDDADVIADRVIRIPQAEFQSTLFLIKPELRNKKDTEGHYSTNLNPVIKWKKMILRLARMISFTE